MSNLGRSSPSVMTVNGRMDSDPIFALPLKPSKDFTIPGAIKISRLYVAIESFLRPMSLQNAYAMPLRVTSGVDVVVVPPFLDSTATVITPFGMLLLQLHGALDATTAASLTTFIKEYTEGLVNMDDTERTRVEELEEQALLLSTLHSIATESRDAESVRMAYAGLLGTDSGRKYLSERQYKL